MTETFPAEAISKFLDEWWNKQKSNPDNWDCAFCNKPIKEHTHLDLRICLNTATQAEYDRLALKLRKEEKTK